MPETKMESRQSSDSVWGDSLEMGWPNKGLRPITEERDGFERVGGKTRQAVLIA